MLKVTQTHLPFKTAQFKAHGPAIGQNALF